MRNLCPSVSIRGFLSAIILCGCSRQPPQGGLLRLGYVEGPLAAPLYAAEAEAGAEGLFRAVPFGGTGDIGYALLSGALDAGFVEPSKAPRLLEDRRLAPAGAVTFPYGATVILRKGLSLRLDDLAGRKVAAHSPCCRFLHQFQTDARRLQVDAAGIRFVYMPFDDMLPALEAGIVDAAVTKGVHALLGGAAGHSVLYQNWEVAETDTCCPQTLAQVEYVLVARGDADKDGLKALVAALAAASDRKPPVLRTAVAARTRIPAAALEGFPVASFAPLTDEQRRALAGDGARDGEKH
jgi:ABC-type nitrate/sulfonate/bicarbonate transport system substrate-binding protein